MKSMGFSPKNFGGLEGLSLQNFGGLEALGSYSQLWRFGGVKPEFKNSKKIKKTESGGITPNDIGSIQKAPRDSQNIEFWRNFKFFNF